jgi:hypothetical protein
MFAEETEIKSCQMVSSVTVGVAVWYYGLGFVSLCHIALTSLHHKYPQPSRDFSTSRPAIVTLDSTDSELCAHNRLLSWRSPKGCQHYVVVATTYRLACRASQAYFKTSRSICSSPVMWLLCLSVSKCGSYAFEERAIHKIRSQIWLMKL